ncbi:LIRP-like [Topomyia yanbarensis]|uniref:LIRP-like n=1 Tax=Topomyia yanbarensis TaxID=2498891 RepID=UPI00273B3A54|nr:LIRP-like [Topomyia yanbarensis]
MRSVLVNPAGALLMVPVLATLLSLLVHQINATPVPAPSNNGDGDLLLHHITRSRYCGRKLTETLAMLCQGRYPMMSHHRSEYLSDQPHLPVEVEVATLPDSGAHGFPYSRSKGHRRVRRAGIYDECCKKSCSYNELRSYCE